MIIAISGTPCTGKTAVAKLLAKKLRYRYIDLNELAEKKNLYAGFDRKRKVKIVDTDSIQKEIDKIKDRNIVMDSHYSHEIENDATIVLRTDIKELRNRMMKKGWPKKKIDENIEAEIMDVCKSEAFELGRKILEIDTAKKRPEIVVKEVIKSIRQGFLKNKHHSK